MFVTKLDGPAKGGESLSAVSTADSLIVFLCTRENFEEDFKPF